MSWKQLTTMINRPNGATLHGLFSTAEDLAIYATMMLQNGKYGNVRILSPASVKARVK